MNTWPLPVRDFWDPAMNTNVVTNGCGIIFIVKMSNLRDSKIRNHSYSNYNVYTRL